MTKNEIFRQIGMENNEEKPLTNARMMAAIITTVLAFVCRDDGRFVPMKKADRSIDRVRSVVQST